MIRPARAGDEAALAAIEVRAALHADELLAPEEAEPDPAAWTAAVVVAEAGGRVVGGARPDRVVVDPAAQGAGVGTALWAAVADRPREAWVRERDPLALAFAAGAGFHPTAEDPDAADVHAPGGSEHGPGRREGALGPEVLCAS